MKCIVPLLLSVILVLSGCTAGGNHEIGGDGGSGDGTNQVAEMTPVISEHGEADSLIDNGTP
ncbi:MAG: hypothetical protein LBT52_03705, partial [Clostridiales Family XIII bacterium]|nr:hypothetical protein [Clostridiales Family XIII bacterium]